MRIRHIEVFHAVYTTGSVTGGAKLLSVSQPSISKVLSQAEAQLGYDLFERVKGRLVPTPEAHELFDDVLRVYECLGRLRSLSQSLSEVCQGNIRMSATPAFGQEIIPRTVHSFLRGRRGVHVEVETQNCSEVQRALINRQVDLGIVFESTGIPGLIEKDLGNAEFVMVLPKGWISDTSPRLPLNALADMPFIKLNDRGPLGTRLNAQLDQSDVEWRTVTTVETYHIAKSLAAMGVGATIVDEITARSNGLEGLDLRYLEPAIEFKIKALWPESAPRSLLGKALLDKLQSELTLLLARKSITSGYATPLIRQ